MDFATKRRVIARLKKWRFWVNALILLGITAYFFTHLPKEILNVLPASGGDTGSHFWPLYTLKNYALQHWQVRAWNPGNLGGEPHLVHYFPLSFFFMAFLSLFMPLGTAFNVGTIFPLAILPWAVFFGVSRMKARFPIPILCALSTLPFLYNEKFSMWGGNTLSTLAGQFSHQYALFLFFLAIGVYFSDLKKGRLPLLSVLLFSMVALTHAYVFLIVPFAFFGAILFGPKADRRFRLYAAFVVGVLTILVSAWFLVPMVDNAKWTTPLPMIWGWENTLKGLMAPILRPFYFVFPLFLILGVFRKSLLKRARQSFSFIGFWLLLISVYFGMYFVFPALGLVDIRAIPQIQLFIMVLSGYLFSLLIRDLFETVGEYLIVLPVAVLILWWVDANVVNFPIWSKWNYSGWQSKALYPDLQNLSQEIRGDLSQPRVIFEHNDINNSAGSLRVFEMLPYFANRATLESLYTQATVLAPAAFYLQARVSLTPSCPFRQFRCAPRRYEEFQPKLELMGVGDLILSTDVVLNKIREQEYLQKVDVFGPWHLYRMKEPPKLVETIFNTIPVKSFEKGWEQENYKWFDKYTGKESFVARTQERNAHHLERSLAGASNNPNCNTALKTDFGGIDLVTSCPGAIHLIKFAYHSTWRADSGDEVFFVSPGFLGIIPSESEIRLDFGQSLLWKLSDWISIIGFFGLIFLMILRRRSESRKQSA